MAFDHNSFLGCYGSMTDLRGFKVNKPQLHVIICAVLALLLAMPFIHRFMMITIVVQKLCVFQEHLLVEGKSERGGGRERDLIFSSVVLLHPGHKRHWSITWPKTQNAHKKNPKTPPHLTSTTIKFSNVSKSIAGLNMID